LFIYYVDINEEKIINKKINSLKISKITFYNISQTKIIHEKFIANNIKNIIKIEKSNEN
jgi:hypothetical protein